MKIKILSLFLFLSAVGIAHANEDTRESPVQRAGTAQSVSVSSSAWTKVTSVSAAAKPPYRAGAFITIPAGSSAACHGVFGSTSTVPSISTATKVIEFPVGSTTFIPVGFRMDFYMVNQGSAAQSIFLQEVSQ
jgi:hypothetical protein